VRFRAEYFYQSKVFFDAANSSYDGAYQPSYGVLNGSITYTPAAGNYDVSLYGKNLADEEYYRNVAIQGRYGLGVPGDPLTYGLKFSWRYK
jgi:iron complex outermembrane receptor protein